jgi:hypothetical protein
VTIRGSTTTGSRDRKLYICFGFYAPASLILLPLTYYYGYGHFSLSIIVPTIALLMLVGFQFNARSRSSAFAVGLVVAGLIAVAIMTLMLSYAARVANYV